MKIRLGEVRMIVRQVLAEARTVDPANALIRLLKLPSGTRRYGDTISWSKAGGHAGETVIRRVVAALEAGWQKGPRQNMDSPDGATIGSGSKYHDDMNNELTVRSSYGATKSSNHYSIDVKLASGQ